MRYIAVLTLGGLLVACASSSEVAGSYTYKTECFGSKMDGSQRVKAWGTGKDKLNAIEQAKKNAVMDVIFSGITEGKQDCKVRPLVVEVNAREKYEDYFDSFFARGGKYKKFAKLEEEKDKIKSREGITCGVILTVLRSKLKTHLKENGIIK